jgi:hypothetical protein
MRCFYSAAIRRYFGNGHFTCQVKNDQPCLAYVKEVPFEGPSASSCTRPLRLSRAEPRERTRAVCPVLCPA